MFFSFYYRIDKYDSSIIGNNYMLKCLKNISDFTIQGIQENQIYMNNKMKKIIIYVSNFDFNVI